MPYKMLLCLQIYKNSVPFLGLLNYYAKFILNLASLLQPLHTLLLAKQAWRWTRECTSVFNKAKSLLAEAPVFSAL